jgi:hypothetical protein
MKNTRLNSILHSSLIACALTIGSFASTQSAAAQSPTDMAEVNIPFAFQTATNHTLPAGQYRVVRESDHLILLRGPAKAAAFVTMNDAITLRAPNHGKLVFDHSGDKYYLRQIWTAGSSTGLECPKSRAEKESLLAQNKQAPETTELAFNTPAPTR